MKQICLATDEDAQQISALRVETFQRSKDFTLLKPEPLHWGEIDRTNTVLCIWEKNQIPVATLRLVRVANEDEAARSLEADLPVPVQFPGVVFNSAGTATVYRRHGFNQLLRYYSILAAQSAGIHSLMSPVYIGASRIAFMDELGYTSHILNNSWQTKLAPNSPRMLYILKSNKFQGALTTIEKFIPQLLAAYPWTGPPIRL